MNMGQSLMALLAIVLFAIITVTINRARIGATMQSVEHQVDLEAINYGQSLMEIVSNIANTETGYTNLETTFVNWTGDRTFNQGSGRTLYSAIEVETSVSFVELGVTYKKVTISVYSEPSRDESSLKARYFTSFNTWW